LTLSIKLMRFLLIFTSINKRSLIVDHLFLRIITKRCSKSSPFTLQTWNHQLSSEHRRLWKTCGISPSFNTFYHW